MKKDPYWCCLICGTEYDHYVQTCCGHFTLFKWLPLSPIMEGQP